MELTQKTLQFQLKIECCQSVDEERGVCDSSVSSQEMALGRLSSLQRKNLKKSAYFLISKNILVNDINCHFVI
jgi:hypothetical protein